MTMLGRKHSAETRAKISAKAKQHVGDKHSQWKGGRMDAGPYISVWVGRDHPMAMGNGRVLEHRLVMAEHLGRPLTSSEVVHHGPGGTKDNRIENLTLASSHSEHRRLHTRLTDAQVREIRALAAIGDITKRAIARRYGFSEQYIGQIVNGRARVERHT
jgi:hypothetical protein